MTTSGKDHIREAIRNRKSNNARLAREIGISSALLNSFSAGDADIPLDKLELLVDDIFHGFVEYNATQDKLRPVEQPPARPLGQPPQLTMKLPVYKRGPPPQGPQPEIEAKPKQPKPGWLNVWE